MVRINASIGFDQRLFSQDIRVSQAHAAMLARQGIITPDEAQAIIKGLNQVRTELEAGEMEFSDSQEDIHTHVEARLKEIIGETAGKLHTARSRNDQVAADLRLWVLEAGEALREALARCQMALVELAENNHRAIMPGYTHVQRAQPILLGHHLLAYYEMFKRDGQRLEECLGRTGVLPLGAAALAGTVFPVDPESVARELGFAGVFANSLDAVSDRDFAVEFVFVLALIQVHLSRLAEELVLWSSQEFGFITLSDAFSTGSSIMPQKKNPDAAELIRGKTGRVTGHLVSLLTMLKGQPLAYNKDLQEDKEAVFDAFDTVLDCLKVMAPMLKNLSVNTGAMEVAVNDGYLNATELADYLASKGIPFREAHGIAGQAVRLAESKGLTLQELGLAELKGLCPDIDRDIFPRLAPRAALAARTSPGGTAPQNLEKAIVRAKKELWPED